MDGERLLDALAELMARALDRDRSWVKDYERATGGAGDAPREPDLRAIKREK